MEGGIKHEHFSPTVQAFRNRVWERKRERQRLRERERERIFYRVFFPLEKLILQYMNFKL